MASRRTRPRCRCWTLRAHATPIHRSQVSQLSLESLEDRLLLAGQPLSSVPALNSLPGAYAQLYLDFVGDNTANWGQNGSQPYHPGITPAYDQDNDPSTFSDGELASIRDIWARVSEKYSPFNINVTTVDPGNINNLQTLRVVIGGDSAWYGPAGGVAYVDAFSSNDPTYGTNLVWIFPSQLGRTSAVNIAEAAAHEAGHAFGLSHQAVWSGSTLVTAYNAGDGLKAPIMGVSGQSAGRGLWWLGPTSASPNSIQDDLSVLSRAANGFGYRQQDRGQSVATATPATVSGLALSGAGVITSTADADYYKFSTAAGAINLAVDVAPLGAMLDATLELRDTNNNVIARSDTASLGESLWVAVGAGTYYAVVRSHGSYGDVGQYTIRGVIAPSSITPTSPVGPAVAVPGQFVSYYATFQNTQPGKTYSAVATWGDGSSDPGFFTTAASGTGTFGVVSYWHTYAKYGQYYPQLTITDSSGNAASISSSVIVGIITYQLDPLDAGKTALVVGGMPNVNNNIQFDQLATGIAVTYNGYRFQVNNVSGSIIAYGQTGNDTLTVNNSIKNSTLLFGGDGNDTLTGGTGSNILIGGNGNDNLYGNVGRDILIGGNGTDYLAGSNPAAAKFIDDSDLLIGGMTYYEYDLNALGAIARKWLSADAYADRVAALRAGAGVPRLDKTTVLNDTAIDTVLGGADFDWLLAVAGKDTTDLTAGELLF